MSLVAKFNISRRDRLILNNKNTSAIADPIAQLQRRFDEFGSSRTHLAKPPEALWQAAVELAREHGLHSVAHPLRLDHMGLKRRLEGLPSAQKKASAPTFVELIASQPATIAEYVIEFESRVRSKMRIQWKGSSTPDGESLLRTWREAER